MVEGISQLSFSTVFSTVKDDVRAIAIANLLLHLLTLRFSHQKLSRQSLTTRSLAAEVTRNRVTKSPARLGTISRQCNGSPPQPRTRRHMAGKTKRAETSIAGHKAIQRGHLVTGIVGDGFQSSELNSTCLRSLRDGGRFHIHRTRAINLAESRFLFLASHSRGSYENPLT